VRNIPLALEKLVKVQHRRLKVGTESANLYANEVYHRLRFAVVEDKEVLENDLSTACENASAPWSEALNSS
jgi:hypothetical protein